MCNKELCETQQSLMKTNRVCRLISVLMKIVFAALCAWWLASIIFMLLTLFGFEIIENGESITWLALGLYAASGLVMATVCVALIKIFSDTSKGFTPFTMLQVRRLRLVAISLVTYVVLEFALTCSAPFVSGSTVNSYTVNFFAIVAAAVVFAFSFVFKYGVLLQELSDETL